MDSQFLWDVPVLALPDAYLWRFCLKNSFQLESVNLKKPGYAQGVVAFINAFSSNTND